MLPTWIDTGCSTGSGLMKMQGGRGGGLGVEHLFFHFTPTHLTNFFSPKSSPVTKSKMMA